MNITEFQYQGTQVRTQLGADGEPLFCAKDVCIALGYSNPRDALDQHTDKNYEVVKRDLIDALGRKQEASFVTESGLYSLIFGSKLPTAKDFKRWVTSEVLPSIRKTGSYGTPQMSRDPLLVDLEAAKLILEPAGITGNQLSLAMDSVYKSQTGVSLLKQAGIQLERPQNSQLCTPTELGRELGISAQDFNKLLEAHHLQARIGGKWEPTDAGRAQGAAVLDTGKRHSNGTPVTQLKWPISILAQI